MVLTIDTDLGELDIQMSGAGAGDYTYTANPAVEHGPEGSPTDDVISDSFTYVVVDGDGDTASANLVINIKDGEPEATTDTISATAAAEHLPGGNEDTAPGAAQADRKPHVSGKSVADRVEPGCPYLYKKKT